MNGMKRWFPVVSLAVLFLVPLAAHAQSVAWTIGIGGWTMTGSEQPAEAQVIGQALDTYGYDGGWNGTSNYRNSVYRFTAINGGYFMLNGANLGSNITIIHEQDWIGVATNLCSYGSFGSESSAPPDISDCQGLVTWGQYAQTLGLNFPPCTVSNTCNNASNPGVLVNGVCSAISYNVVDTQTLTPSGHFLGTYDDFKWNDQGTVFSANKVCSLAGLPQMATGRVLCAPDLNTHTTEYVCNSSEGSAVCSPEDVISYYAQSRHNGDWNGFNNQGYYSSGQGWCQETGIAWVECGSPTAVSAPSDSSCPAPVYGCTDSTASNYNPSATVSDGSCTVLPDITAGNTPTASISVSPVNISYGDASTIYVDSANSERCGLFSSNDGRYTWTEIQSTPPGGTYSIPPNVAWNTSTGALTTTTDYGFKCVNLTTKLISDWMYATVNVCSQSTPTWNGNSCVAISGCTATTINNCSLSATDSGGSSGSCTSGGTCKYTCDNGTWTEDSNSCSILPNLTADAVAPTSATSGITITFFTSIHNADAPTGAGFNTLFQKATSLDSNGDGVNVTNIGIYSWPLSLATGGVVTASLPYKFNLAGTYYMRACADMNLAGVGGITESNEKDNCGVWTLITVQPAASCPNGGPPVCDPACNKQ